MMSAWPFTNSTRISSFTPSLFTPSLRPNTTGISRDVPVLEKWFGYMSTLLVTDDSGDIIFKDLPEALCILKVGNQLAGQEAAPYTRWQSDPNASCPARVRPA